MKKYFIYIIIMLSISSIGFAKELHVTITDLESSLISLEKTRYNILLTEDEVNKLIEGDASLKDIIKAGTPVTYKSLDKSKYDDVYKRCANLYASLVLAKHIVTVGNKDIDEYEKSGAGLEALEKLMENSVVLERLINNQAKEAPGIQTDIQALKPSEKDFTLSFFGKTVPDAKKYAEALAGVKLSLKYAMDSVKEYPIVAKDYAKLVARLAKIKKK